MLGIGLSLAGSTSSTAVLSQTPSLDLDFTTGVMPASVTFTRASPATRFNASGVLETVGTNVARFDHDPVTLAARGLLVEEARTNLVIRSTEFNTGWTASGLTVGANTSTAPDGTLSADTLTATGDDASISQAVTVSASTAYAGSVWLRAAAPTTIRLYIIETAGAAGLSHTVCSVTTQWQRFEVVRTLSVGTTQAKLQVGGGGSFNTGATVIAFGAQLEAGTFATSYVPTTTAAVTRAADVATVGTFTPWFNPVEGTMVAEYSFSGIGSGLQTIWSIDDATANERHTLRLNAGVLGSVVVDGGATQASFGLGALTAGPVARTASAFALNDFAVSLNGGAVSTDAAGTLPTVTRLTLGSRLGAEYLSGYLRRVRYYRARRSAADLQALTTS
jgi:hypothetical protein